MSFCTQAERRRAQFPRNQPGDAGADGQRRHGRDAAAVAGAAGREPPRATAGAALHDTRARAARSRSPGGEDRRCGSRSSRWRRRSGRRCPRSPRRVAVAARDHGSRPQRDTDRTDPIPDGTPITRGSTPRWDADDTGPRIRLQRDADYTDSFLTGRGLRGVHGSDHHGARMTRIHSSDGTQITRIHGSDHHGTRITRIHFSRDADRADSRIKSPRDADYADHLFLTGRGSRGFTDQITTGRGLRGSHVISHGTRIARITRIKSPQGRGLRGFISHGTRIARIHGSNHHGTRIARHSRPHGTGVKPRVTSGMMGGGTPPFPAKPEPSPPAARPHQPVIISDFSHGALTTRVRRTPMLRLKGEAIITSSARV